MTEKEAPQSHTTDVCVYIVFTIQCLEIFLRFDYISIITQEHMIQSEVSILRRVKHPNIVLLIEEMDTYSDLYLVMELVKVRNIF